MKEAHKKSKKKLSSLYTKKDKKDRFLLTTDRIDFRIETKLKDLFLKAALISGNQSLTNFIISTVRERSLQLLDEHERLVLSQKDWELVLSLLDNPPRPNVSLNRAKQTYKKLIKKVLS